MDQFCELLRSGAYVRCYDAQKRLEILQYVYEHGLDVTKGLIKYYQNGNGAGGGWNYIRYECNRATTATTPSFGPCLTYEDFLAYTSTPAVVINAQEMSILFDEEEF